MLSLVEIVFKPVILEIQKELISSISFADVILLKSLFPTFRSTATLELPLTKTPIFYQMQMSTGN
jgi:hypothetical protein